MLHRLTPAGVEAHVPWETVGWKRQVDDYARLPWQASALGSPSLMLAAGAVYACTPSAAMLVRYDPAGKGVRTWNVPVRTDGRAIVSMTVTPGGRVIALFPLERSERLDGRYGFYELDTAASQWRPLPRLGTVPRGARLAGSSSGALFVWDRARQVVERRPL